MWPLVGNMSKMNNKTDVIAFYRTWNGPVNFYKFMHGNSDGIRIYFSFVYFEPNGKHRS